MTVDASPVVTYCAPKERDNSSIILLTSCLIWKTRRLLSTLCRLAVSSDAKHNPITPYVDTIYWSTSFQSPLF